MNPSIFGRRMIQGVGSSIVLVTVGIAWAAAPVPLVEGVARQADVVRAEAPAAQADGVVRYDGAKQVRISVKTPEQLEAVERSGGTILNCIPGVGKMDVVLTPEQLIELEKLGLAAKVMHEDVQALIDKNRPVAGARAGDPFNDFFLDYHPYVGVGGIVWYMNELMARYPALASMVNVGTTLEGRTIWGLRVTSSVIVDKPAVVYFGCEHAREWVTTTIPNYFATRLLENYGVDPQVTDLVDHVEFFLIPVFNVDGYEYTLASDRLWRKNRRDNGGGVFGVDINRNWGEGWGGEGASTDPNSQTYRGIGLFSEPETQVMRDFFLAHSNVRAQLDIHSYSQLILWPFGYTSASNPDNGVYQDVGFAMKAAILGVHGKSYAAGPVYTAIYPASGVSVDWTYAQRDVFSFSFECRDTGTFGFELPADQIIPNNEELLPAMLLLTDSDWVRAAIRFDFPNGLPQEITAGLDTPIAVQLVPQSETVVSGSAKMFYRYDPSGPFLETTLTALGGDAYQAVLPATNCTSTPEFYFSVGGSLGSVGQSPRDAPAEGVYSATMTTGAFQFYSQDFSTNPGWTFASQWAYGQPTGGGSSNHDPTSGFTGTKVYGYNLSGDYANNLPARTLTSTAIDCSGRSGVHLVYRRWLGVESNSSFDEATIEASNNGVNWTVFWRATDTGAAVADTSWQLQTVDISAAADNQPTVYLRWGMGPTDGGLTYPGWNIDDVTLTAAQCASLAGDFNGDGAVDGADYAAFTACFALPSGGAIAPGCTVFDFDSDGNQDCDDWTAFVQAWTAGGSAPFFAPCGDGNTPPTVLGPAKNRYVSFQPGETLGVAQAFRVQVAASATYPATVGIEKWVGSPAGNGTATLQCAPHFQVWNSAIPVHVGDQEIVPNSTYVIATTTDGVQFSAGISISTSTKWGDCVGPFNGVTWSGPNGFADFQDILACVQTFQGLTIAPPLSWVDVHPAVPNRIVNFADVMMLVQGFQNLAYPFAPATPCP